MLIWSSPSKITHRETHDLSERTEEKRSSLTRKHLYQLGNHNPRKRNQGDLAGTRNPTNQFVREITIDQEKKNGERVKEEPRSEGGSGSGSGDLTAPKHRAKAVVPFLDLWRERRTGSRSGRDGGDPIWSWIYPH